MRSANELTGYRSPDGVAWTLQGTASFIMPRTVCFGLALTSHNNSTLSMGTFDNVTAPTWPGPTPHIGNASIAGGNLVFSGTNGPPGGTYSIWSATNVAVPPTNWMQVGSGCFDGNGNFSATNSINAIEARRFYLLRRP